MALKASNFRAARHVATAIRSDLGNIHFDKRLQQSNGLRRRRTFGNYDELFVWKIGTPLS
jgi:hypothetical protein